MILRERGFRLTIVIFICLVYDKSRSGSRGPCHLVTLVNVVSCLLTISLMPDPLNDLLDISSERLLGSDETVCCQDIHRFHVLITRLLVTEWSLKRYPIGGVSWNNSRVIFRDFSALNSNPANQLPFHDKPTSRWLCDSWIHGQKWLLHFSFCGASSLEPSFKCRVRWSCLSR